MFVFGRVGRRAVQPEDSHLFLLLFGLVLFLEGKEISRRLLFPIGLLFFAIPAAIYSLQLHSLSPEA